MLDIVSEGILRVFAVIHMSYHRDIASDKEQGVSGFFRLVGMMSEYSVIFAK